jgi:hypothetical protein
MNIHKYHVTSSANHDNVLFLPIAASGVSGIAAVGNLPRIGSVGLSKNGFTITA